MITKTCPECEGCRTIPITIIDVTADFECPKCDGKGFIETNMKTLTELGQIMIDNFGKEACQSGYKIDATDLAEVGRQALLFGDINRDGTLN